MTPEQREPETGTVRPLEPVGETSQFALSESLQPAKLKLKLPNMPTEPASKTSARRSDRNGQAKAKYVKKLTDRGAPKTETKSTQKRALQPKPTSLPPVRSSRPPREFTDTGTGYGEGDVVHNVEGATTTERHEDRSLGIVPGNVNDPIDVDALPSPPPHVSRTASYYTPFPLQYRPSRPNIPPILCTPNGAEILSGKVSGHQSHDIYRSYIELKDAPAPPGFAIGCARLSAEISAGKSQSTRHLDYVNEHRFANVGITGQQYAKPLQRRYQSYPYDYRAHTASYHTPVHGYPIFPVLNEEHLRQRAVQFVLHHSRPRTRKRRLSDDPDETSSSEYEDIDEQPRKKTKNSPLAKRSTTPSQPSDEVIVSTPSTGISEDNIFDRNMKLTELVEHTQLLTAMLMTYPRSADQQGLREDLAMLATVTDKRLANWVSAESDFERDTRHRLASAIAPSPNTSGPLSALFGRKGNYADQKATGESTWKLTEEDEVRRYLSTESKVWNNEIRQEKAVEDSGIDGEGMNDSAFETDEAAPSIQNATLPPELT